MPLRISPAAVVAKGSADRIRPVVNCLNVQKRFRLPTPTEAEKVGVGLRFSTDVRVARDEGLLIVRAGAVVYVFTLTELGLT